MKIGRYHRRAFCRCGNSWTGPYAPWAVCSKCGNSLPKTSKVVARHLTWKPPFLEWREAE